MFSRLLSSLLQSKPALAVVTGIFVILTSYQNCGPAFRPQTTELSSLGSSYSYSLFLTDSQTGSSKYSKDGTVQINVQSAVPMAGWCLSEAASQPGTEDCYGQSWSAELPSTYTFSSGEGHKTVRLWAKAPSGMVFPDAASASIMIDGTAPIVDFKIAESGLHLDQYLNVKTGEFRFLLADLGSGIEKTECKLDTNAPQECVGSFGLTALSEGQHIFTVRSLDKAGNERVFQQMFVVDTVAPVVSFLAKPAALEASKSAAFEIATAENGSGVEALECKLDQETFSSCASPSMRTNLSDGNHTFQVRARDKAKNMSAPVTVTWKVDTTVPAVQITSAPEVLTSLTSGNFSFSSTAAGVTYQCKLDTGAFSNCTSPKTYSNLAEGPHRFEVKAITPNGLSSSDSHSWAIDRTLPIITITSRPSNPSYQLNAQFEFTASDSGGLEKVECRIDQSPFATCTSPMNYTNLSASSHVFEARAIDKAKNVSPVARYSWVIDTAAPQISITAKPTHPTNSRSASFTVTSTSTDATFQCQLDAAAFASCTFPKSYSSLTDGAHSFQVRATRPNGASATATYSWSVDTVKPVPTIVSSPPKTTTVFSATFDFSASDSATGVANIECRLDQQTFATCVSPKTYSGLTGGTHSFEVRAKDGAQNISAPVSYQWVIDTQVPSVTITSAPGTSSSSSSAQFLFSSPSTDATFQCRVDSQAFSACNSPKSYSALASGLHRFEVKATRPNGLEGTDSHSWTVDVGLPTSTILSGPATYEKSTSAQVQFSGSDALTGITKFECGVDQGSFAVCTNPLSLTGLSEGNHAVRVVAIDGAGNRSPPDTISWTVDVTPPSAMFTSAPANLSQAKSFSFAWTQGDSGSGLLSTECMYNGTTVACGSPYALNFNDGNHRLDVRVRDRAHNLRAITVTWTSDSTAPVIAIISRPPAQSTSQSATFDFTVSDNSAEPAAVLCALDGQNVNCSARPYTLTNLSDGTHTHAITATDRAGNAATSMITWVVDTAPNTPAGTFAQLFSGNAYWERIDRTDCEKFRRPGMSDATLKLRCRQITTNDDPNRPSSMNHSTSIIPLDGKWYMFNREYNWESDMTFRSYCTVAADHSRMVVRVSSDQGRSWSAPSVVVPLPNVTKDSSGQWVSSDGISAATHPYTCGVMDGTAFFEPESSQWHLLTQCIGPQGYWRVCHFVKDNSSGDPRNPVGAWKPTYRMKNGVNIPFSIDLIELSAKLRALPNGFPPNKNLLGEGTVEIIEAKRGGPNNVMRYYASLHAHYESSSFPGDAGARILARTSDWINWDVYDPTDPLLRGRPLMAQAECNSLGYPWKNTCRGAGHFNTKKEGEYYYSFGESMDSSFGIFPAHPWRVFNQLYTYNIFRSKTLYDWEPLLANKPQGLFPPRVLRSEQIPQYSVLWSDATGNYAAIAQGGTKANYLGMYRLVQGTEPLDFYRRDPVVPMGMNEFTWANRLWVRVLYKNLLGRSDAAISDEEVHFWGKLIDDSLYNPAAGIDRQEVARRFATTNEFSNALQAASVASSQDLVNWLFSVVLAAPANQLTEKEKGFWIAQLASGMPRDQVVGHIMSASSRIVHLFNKTLGRNPASLDDVKFRVQQLESYTYRELVSEFIGSAEGRAYYQIDKCATDNLTTVPTCMAVANTDLRNTTTSNCELDYIRNFYAKAVEITPSDEDICFQVKYGLGNATGNLRIQARQNIIINSLILPQITDMGRRRSDFYFFSDFY